MSVFHPFLSLAANVRFRPIADISAEAHVANMVTFTALSKMITVALLACCSVQATAKGGDERWTAYSRTAMAVTGDILLSPTRLRAVGTELPLKVMADLPDFQNDLDQRVVARVLAVTRRLNPTLRNGNTFCGTRPIRWIVVWQNDAGKGLGIDMFAGSRMPHSANDVGFCASYFYSRK